MFSLHRGGVKKGNKNRVRNTGVFRIHRVQHMQKLLNFNEKYFQIFLFECTSQIKYVLGTKSIFNNDNLIRYIFISLQKVIILMYTK